MASNTRVSVTADLTTRDPRVAQPTIQQLMYDLLYLLSGFSLIGELACAATKSLKNSKVITFPTLDSDRSFVSMASPLLTWAPVEALVNHIAAPFQHQERLLEETRRELEATRRELEETKREN